MRYLPLLWAALMRKPARAILTLLSVAVAFTLFGLMVGLNATFDIVAARASADRVFSNPRFGGTAPLAQARQVAAMPGVKAMTAINVIPGYITDPKNHAFVIMVDAGAGRVFADWGITQDQWSLIQKNRTGVVMSLSQAQRWHKKVGDMLTVISPSTVKADGGKTWTFKVVGIGADFSELSNGYILGNYDYFDKALPVSAQGKVAEVDFLADDPARAPELARQVDQAFANSPTPLQTMTDKMARSAGNNFGGLDIKAVTRAISLAGLFMILFLTANGIAQSVRERFAEFATLKTIGFSDSAVVTLVVLEAAVPCVAGAALGVGIAAWLAELLPGLMPPGFGLPMPTMAPVVFGWAAIAAAAIALASAALPALRLARMDIATALSGRMS